MNLFVRCQLTVEPAVIVILIHVLFVLWLTR